MRVFVLCVLVILFENSPRLLGDSFLQFSNVSVVDMEALESLYNTTNGHKWIWRIEPAAIDNLTSSAFGSVWNFSTSSTGYYLHNPCKEKWQGICCAGNHMDNIHNLTAFCSHINYTINTAGNGQLSPENSIIGVVLPAYGLNGHLPDTFFNLTSLLFLSMSYNHRLRGEIPLGIGQLKRLSYLDLQNNNIIGEIPTTIGCMNSLAEVSLDHNMLEGTLPATLGHLSLLKQLFVHNNLLVGVIPAALGNLTSLTELSLDHNFFEGSIPSSLGGLSSLVEFYLDHNILQGTIPSALAGLRLLVTLGLNNNLLEGTIPWVLGELSLLQGFYVSFNMLDGTVPVALGQLTNLDELYLNSNLLDGPIPLEFGLLTLLVELYLDFNMFWGSIPESIGYLTNVVSIYMNNNLLEGAIPTSVGQLLSLTVLTGGSNSLSGPLPQEFSKLTNLSTLLLQSNYLTGHPLNSLNIAQHKLSTVDFSGNSFSCSFPSAMFQFASMQSVSLVSNCFTGSISSSLCLSSSLQVLALDGLTSGTECRKRLFGAFATVYVVKSYMHGTVPSCLFSMSSLAVLQLSGNGLSGQLPSSTGFSLSSSLHNLSLSHNRLHGAIPVAFQQHDFKLLDLSFNKLSGTVNKMNNFFAFSSARNRSKLDLPDSAHRELTLQVNRLSGTVPSTFAIVKNIRIVYGNLFTCSTTNELPANDPGTELVQCGSQELNIVLIMWLVMLFMAATGIFFIKKFGSSSILFSKLELREFGANQAIYVLILAATGLVLAYWLVGELVIKLVSGQKYSTHVFQYAYTPSLAFMTSNAPAVWTLISAMAWMSFVFVMLTRHQSKTIYDQQQSIQWREVLAVSVLICLDWTAMTLANFGYIYTILYSKSWESNLAQIALTAFKLAVNGSLLPAVLLKISLQNSQLILAGLLLCNNLLIPIITIICTEPNCFSELFVSAPSVSSLFVYIQPCRYTLQPGTCLGFPAEVQMSYQPPFIYTFQCSSTMLTTYLPVFVMMYTYIGLIQPLIVAGLTFGNIRYKSRWSMIITGVMGCDIMLPAGQGCNDSLYNGSQLSVMFICHAVTLLTFGTAYPLLSVLICTAVCVEAVQWRVLIAYYMQSCAACSDQIKRATMANKLQKSSKGLDAGELLYECRWMVMTVMAIFFAFFLMDMAGDKAGDDWSKIVWAPVTMLLWPVVNWIVMLSCHSSQVANPRSKDIDRETDEPGMALVTVANPLF